MTSKTITVRYTTFRYTGWRKWWRRLTLRPVEGPTYEFEALPPQTVETDEYIETGFSIRPVGPIRRVEP